MKRKRKFVSLTFDDGPDEIYTPRILDVLKEHGVQATFFLVGKRSQRYPGIVRRIHDEGHDIGNHTYSHPVSPFLCRNKEKFIRDEIMRTNAIIKKITGSKPLLFRSTLAFWDTAVKELIAQARACGHLPVGWTCSAVDWLGSRALIKRSLGVRARKNRDIILLHDGAERCLIKCRQATVDALPEIIESYRRNNFDLISLTDALL